MSDDRQASALEAACEALTDSFNASTLITIPQAAGQLPSWEDRTPDEHEACRFAMRAAIGAYEHAQWSADMASIPPATRIMVQRGWGEVQQWHTRSGRPPDDAVRWRRWPVMALPGGLAGGV